MNNPIPNLLIVLNGNINNIIQDIMLLVRVMVELIGFCIGNVRINRWIGLVKMKIIRFILRSFDALLRARIEECGLGPDALIFLAFLIIS